MKDDCTKMSMSPTEAYENLVIRAVITNDNTTWTEAYALSQAFNFAPYQVERCHANVERWLRLHGVTSMEAHEKAATLLIQSVIRRWLVRRVLKQQYDMYARLAQFDSPDYCKRAISLEKTLARAWEHIHGR